MKLRAPFYLENFFQDQPYFSLLLIAPYCDFSCYNCQNRHLSANEVRNFTIEKLAAVFGNNPFVEGITIGGLEPLLSPGDFIKEVVELIRLTGIRKVTFYTRFTSETKQVKELLAQLATLDLDLLCLKTGRYISSLEEARMQFVEGGENWQINLGSKNQDFEVLKGSWQRIHPSLPRGLARVGSNSYSQKDFLKSS